MGIDIDSLTVECPVTGERLPRFTKEHATKLRYPSLTKFRKEHGLDYNTAAQRSRQAFKRLYNVDFKRWVVGYQTQDEGMRYVTKIYEQGTTSHARAASRFPLSDGNFNAHFNGANPLAIFAFGNRSRYFGFDVDSKEEAPADAKAIIATLKEMGFDSDDIHVSFSGGKGYHIELFIDGHLPFQQWRRFGRTVLQTAGLTEDTIEFRPTSNNSHAWKLPLTMHPKTRKFAGYCDLDTLEVLGVQESHDYLVTIRQMPTSKVVNSIGQAADIDEPVKPKKRKDKSVKVVEQRLFKTTEEKRLTAVKLLTSGLPGSGTRWNAMRNVLIPYLKVELGCDESETKTHLMDFCKKELEAGRTTTPMDVCEKEIDDLIEGFYPIVDGIYSVVRELEISRTEIDWVVSVVEKGGTRMTRDLLWALLLLQKAYKTKKGDFFASRESVQALLTVPRTISPTTLQKSRDWLAKHEFIEFTVPKNAFTQRKATTYKLLNEEIGETEILDQLHFSEEMDSRALLHAITERLYTPRELKLFKLS